MITAWQRLQRAIAIHGLLGTCRLGARHLSRRVLWLTPSAQRGRSVRQERESTFDRRWGSDTGGDFVPAIAEVVGPNWKHGIRYQGCNATALARVLASLSIDYETFQFVDLGCGKGRAVLVAARFPFRRIVGLEYSTQLCQVARHNVSCFPKHERKCGEIDVVCGDAATFQIPDGPLLIFLYNPFGKKVMNQVVQNVRASHRQDPRRIIVVYFNGLFADLWKSAGFMEEVRRATFITIYDTQPRPPLQRLPDPTNR